MEPVPDAATSSVFLAPFHGLAAVNHDLGALVWVSWEAGHRAVLPDASREPDDRFNAADHQQLRVSAVPVTLLPEVRQQGEPLKP